MTTDQFSSDRRIILTLDAGGTNFVFSAMQGNQEVVKPIQKPAFSNDLDRCLSGVAQGFEEVIQNLNEKPVAISFAFPGTGVGSSRLGASKAIAIGAYTFALQQLDAELNWPKTIAK